MEEENFNFRPHGCALCKNLFDLREPCCCPQDSNALTEIKEPRLLKRCNLKKGNRLCPTHYDKAKNGLIFGVEKSGCCAPFHVDASDGNRLRPVPRMWRHLFDGFNVRERYLPSLQICSRCYEITLDLVLRGDSNDEKSVWDLSPTSPASTHSSGSYTSPRRWLSSFTLHANESTTSGSSLSSSTTRLSTASSGYLLSLYETHREKLGHPRAVPDSIKRYFTYGQSTSSLPGRKTPILRHRKSFESIDSSEKFTDDEDKKDKKLNLTSSLMASLKKPALDKLPSDNSETEPKYYSSSPELSLNFTSSDLTPSSRKVCRLNIASSEKSDVLRNRILSESMQSTSSSDLNSDWETISLSLFNDLDSETEENNISRDADITQDDSEQTSLESLVSSTEFDERISNDARSTASGKPMSINIQFIVNPNLKRARLSNQVETCKSYDSFSTSTDELIARAENFEVLELISNNSGSQVDHFNRLDNLSSYDTSDCMSGVSVDENFPINSNYDAPRLLAERFDTICEKLLNSGLFRSEDISEMLDQIDQTNRDAIHVYAGTLAQCAITFALQDVEALLACKEESQANTDSLLQAEVYNLENVTDDSNLPSSSMSNVIGFADLKAQNILTDAYENLYGFEQERPKSYTTEFSFSTCAARRLKLSESNKHYQNNRCLPETGVTVIKWLERKRCYRTVFSVRFQDKSHFKQSNLDSLTHIDGPTTGAALALQRHDENNILVTQPRIRSVECVVDDLILISRSLSTSLIDKHDDTLLNADASYLPRASSHDSFFTLTCQPLTNFANLDEQFIAVPVKRRRNEERESGVFLSTSERMSSEDDDFPNPSRVALNDDLSTFENLSLSSDTTDFSSSSTMDNCDSFEAELLEKSKIFDRPHFVSHKSRIEEINDSIPQQASIPFELKPDLKPLTINEEEEDELKSLGSFNANAIESESQYEESHYEDAASTAEAKTKDTVDDSTENTKTDEEDEDKLPEEYPRKKKISSLGRRETKSFDWYIGEDLLEQRRSKQLLKALSNAALFTKHTQKQRREIRPRKTDEDPEDDDVSDVLGLAMQEWTPKLLFRKRQENESESSGRNFRTVFRVVAIAGFIGSLFYAGLKYYT